MSNDYCSRTNIERHFGTENVAEWADLDSDDDATKITNQVNWAISGASDDFDSIAQAMGERVPVKDEDGSTPSFVTFLVACMAGWLLHGARGMVEGYPDPYEQKWKWMFGVLQNIQDGTRKIPGAV